MGEAVLGLEEWRSLPVGHLAGADVCRQPLRTHFPNRVMITGAAGPLPLLSSTAAAGRPRSRTVVSLHFPEDVHYQGEAPLLR
jgi:hypothetical protein